MVKEKIVRAAIKYTVDGGRSWGMTTGKRHSDCIRVFAALGIKVNGREEVQGFITDANNFLTREQALKLALYNGQFDKSKVPPTKKFLCSEDLW